MSSSSTTTVTDPATGADQRETEAASGARPKLPAFHLRVMFVMGVLFTGWAASTIVDQVGPRFDRAAVVDGHHIEVSRGSSGRRHETYVVDATDDHGVRFEVHLPSSQFDEVRDGQRFTVERSLVTGRVVGVSGVTWSMSSAAWRISIGAFAVLLGGSFVFGAAWADRRGLRPKLEARAYRRHLVYAGLMCVAAVAALCGRVMIQRAEVLDAAPRPDLHVPAAVALPTSPACEEVARATARLVPAVVSDGVLDAAEVDDIVEILPIVGYECADMRDAVCAGAQPTNGAAYVIAEPTGCRA